MENYKQPTEQRMDWDEKKAEDKDSVIDLGRIFQALFHYLWLIITCAFVVGGLAFGYTKLFVPVQYNSKSSVYVSNDVGNNNIQSSNEYVANAFSYVITSTDTLQKVIDKNEFSYSVGVLKGMVKVEVMESAAGVLTITVTSTNAHEATAINNGILSVLLERGEEVFTKGNTVSIIDNAGVAYKAGPSTVRNTILGALIGAVVCCVVIVVIERFNNKIYDDEYLISTYGIPVLANIPDFVEKQKKGGDYYHYYRYEYASHYHD